MTEGTSWHHLAQDAISKIYYFSKYEPVAFELDIIHELTYFWLELIHCDTIQESSRHQLKQNSQYNIASIERLKRMMTCIINTMLKKTPYKF